MRKVVLDTETTGFDPFTGDRIVEIGCVELIDNVPTAKTYHQYINPERAMPSEAYAVHGLSEEFLQDFPTFENIATKFRQFIDDAPLIIQNAAFDMKFINYEFSLIGIDPIPSSQAIDTVVMAREKFPGSPVSLDALCRRFGIDNSHREKHGALLDSTLLAEVYQHLISDKQPDLLFADKQDRENAFSHSTPLLNQKLNRPSSDTAYRAPRKHPPLTPKERQAHADCQARLGDAIWARYDDFIS